MEHIKQVSERLVQLIPTLTHPEFGIRENIRYFTEDILRMMKNIRETSLNETDRLSRIQDLSNQCGIDLTIYL